MGGTLLNGKKVLVITAFLISLAGEGVLGQSILAPGDVAIVTVNSGTRDSFDFIPLVDIEEGTEIYFTDHPYIASGDSLKETEGVLRYSARQSLAAGEVVSFNGTNTNGFIETGNYNLGTDGDNILVYQVNPDTTFVTGAGWSQKGSAWKYDETLSGVSSDVPSSLSEENYTILDLGESQNFQYPENSSLKGTAKTLRADIGNVAKWNENDDKAYDSFSSAVEVLDPPTVAFSSSELSVREGDISELGVKLVEATGTAVSVDVVFLDGSSSAGTADVGNYVTQTIRFAENDTSGTVLTAPVSILGEDSFEGNETAVFQLQNNTAGTIIEPASLRLFISDSDAPEVVVNEIFTNPPTGISGDANGDGISSASDDQFIEFVNKGSSDVDMSGWQLTTDGGENVVIYTFSSGSILPAGRAMVVFGGGVPDGNFGGAVLQTATELDLREGRLILLDDQGIIIQDITYDTESGDGSMTRNPELSGSFHSHSKVGAGALFSPGTKVGGTPFGAKHAVGIRGAEGWRLIASPVSNVSFDELLGNFWMQGIAGSDDPAGESTIYEWTEENGGALASPSSMTDRLVPGKGYLVYFHEDEDLNTPGLQGGFPKILSSNKSENSGSVSVSVSATDSSGNGAIDKEEGWNLLGNPFNVDISVMALLEALEAADTSVQANVYVWDRNAGNGNGAYEALSSGDLISPFQAFFVRYNSVMDGTVTLDKNVLEAKEGAEFYKDITEDAREFDLELHGNQKYDSYRIEFSDDGSVDLDRFDGYKRISLNRDAISLFSTLSGSRLQKNVLPSELDANIDIPLTFSAEDQESLVFRWKDLENLPEEWEVVLVDKQINREVSLKRAEEYRFNNHNFSSKEKPDNRTQDQKLLKQSNPGYVSRFVLSIRPTTKESVFNDELSGTVKLNPNYPNPFNPTTTIPYELTQNSEVRLTIWNMIGQKVATLVEGMVEAGTHTETWNASNMPSGMYIARFEVNGEVFTRKMTLIK